MFIARVTAVTDELVDAFARLLPQLKLSYPSLSRREMEALVSSSASI
jgi:hypothetical protein